MRIAIPLFILFLFIGIVVLVISMVFGGTGQSTSPESFGVMRSSDRGETWERTSMLSDGGSIGRMEVLSFASHPAVPDTVLAGTRSAGLFRSKDRAGSWEPVSDENGLLSPRATVYDIAFSSEDASVFYLAVLQGDRGQILKAEENGKKLKEVLITSAIKLQPSKLNQIFTVGVHPLATRTVFAGTEEGLLLRSEDGGESWQRTYQFPAPVVDLLLPSADERAIFVISGRALFRSFDYGETFEEMKERFKEFPGGNEVHAMAFEPAHPQTIYLGTAFGLLKSTDSGETFTPMPLIIPRRALPVRAIALDPTDFRHLYVSAGDVVYASRDVGNSWSPVRVTQNLVGQLLVHPGDPQVIYAGLQAIPKK